MDSKVEQGWIDVLVKLYEKKLKLDDELFRTGTKKDTLLSHLEVLEVARKKVMETKDPELERLYKEFYHDIYVIKEKDIPYSVYEREQRIAREEGYGDIPITEEYIRQKNEEIINNQKESLDKWLDYFLYDEEAKLYNSFEVFWVLEGLQKLGRFNKEQGKFKKRDKSTIYAYPSVEKQAIFTSVGLMEEYLKDKNKSQLELRDALSKANFKQLYEFSLNQLMFDRVTNGVEGKWVKYDQGSDYHILRDSLQGYNTGWCTAAGEEFAKEQLEGGDFYVYYSIDKNGEYKIPRIAIRMDGHDIIGEIRGVEKNQHMELEMLPILEEKLKEFPDADEYYKKEHDMKYLTMIDKKVKQGDELNVNELRFLYEIDYRIEGFGWEKDPRVNEIKKDRNAKKDYSIIYNCNEDEVALTQNEWEKDPSKIKLFVGKLDLSGLTSTESLTLPETIKGSIDLSGLTSAEGLVLPQTVGGALVLSRLTSAKSLTLPQSIGGSIWLSSLTNIEGLVLPETIRGALDLGKLTSIEGLALPQTVGGDFYLYSLTDAKGLVLPQTVGGDLNLSGLTSAEGLVLPQSIGRDLDLSGLTSAEGLILPQSIGGSLSLYSLTNTVDLILPQYVEGHLNLQNLESAKNLILPQYVGGHLDLRLLLKVESLVLPQTVEFNFYLNSLTDVKGLIFPDELTYTIRMNGFDITPENVDEYRKKQK